jgi:glycosyltransferase involved in cell wall biosynthesis
MRIWHVGASARPKDVTGVNTTVWLVAQHQAELGHQVSLLVEDPTDSLGEEICRRSGVRIVHVPGNTFHYRSPQIESALEVHKPELVHMHSVYVAKQGTLARLLQRRGIPYVVTPHGGLAFDIMKRGWLKKTIYGHLVERRRFHEADALTIVTPAEEPEVRAFAPKLTDNIHWVGNPVDLKAMGTSQWTRDIGRRRLVYLGRFAVFVKGIDILAAMAALLPDTEFHLYGVDDPRSRKQLEALKSRAPANLHFKNPVFGQDKIDALCNASVYVHMARSEGFPISIAESMHLGIPCALSESIHLSSLFRREDLGLVLSSDPVRAAPAVRAILDQPEKLDYWAKKARKFSDANFNPTAAAQKYISVYDRVLRARQTGAIHPVEAHSLNITLPMDANAPVELPVLQAAHPSAAPQAAEAG